MRLRVANWVLRVRTVSVFVLVFGASTISIANSANAGAAPITPYSSSAFVSQIGDYVGAGQAYTFNSVTYSGLRSVSPNQFPTFDLVNTATNDFYQLWFAAPLGEKLAVGTYSGVMDADARTGTSPGMALFGDGRGCSVSGGSFTVFQVSYDSSGDVTSFAAQFSIDLCSQSGGAPPPVDGYISFNATVSLPTWLVSNAPQTSFEDTRAGDASSTKDLEFGNMGASTGISGPTIGGADPDDFIGTSNCRSALDQGQACSVSEFFAPGTIGPRQATLGVSGSGQTVTDTLSGNGTAGYYLASSSGAVGAYGDAQNYGDLEGQALNAPIVNMATTIDGYGYWLLGRDGGVFSFGDAPFFGSTGNIPLNKPVVAMTATADSGGYWFVASDGGVFAFGDAGFHGSTGALNLNKPIVGMTATPDGGGYWLVASDGGIFAFGDAAFHGSTGALHLNKPIVGMAVTPDGGGYWLVASDGGVFAFGDAQFYGSTGAVTLNQPIVAMAATWDGLGYWFAAADGGLFDFGDAPFDGSGATTGMSGVVAVAPTAPPTVQAILDLPALRHSHRDFDAGWRAITRLGT